MEMAQNSGYRYPFAYVAFGGRRTKWWMCFLKRGFYHCALLLGNGYEWILIDPLIHYTDLIVIKNTAPIRVLQEKGYRLVRTTPVVPERTKTPFRPLTCVEVVKRFLGINNPFIWTPYQLFCYFYPRKGK